MSSLRQNIKNIYTFSILIGISGDSASYFLEMIMLGGSVGNKPKTNTIAH